jgi:hypothetical protein
MARVTPDIELGMDIPSLHYFRNWGERSEGGAAEQMSRGASFKLIAIQGMK